MDSLKLLDPEVDDRVITTPLKLQALKGVLSKNLTKAHLAGLTINLRETLRDMYATAGADDTSRLRELRDLVDGLIVQNIVFLRHELPRSGPLPPGAEQLDKWITDRQGDQKSVYSCYN